AMSRLGKQVIDVMDVSASYDGVQVIDGVTWHIGAGDRYGILGENGAGKTTLLRLIMGKQRASKGYVKIGKTVKFAYLSQELEGLRGLEDDRVREVLGRYKTRYEIEGKELTPAQLLERLGFENSHLNSRVRDLSGGQRRRLMLMLILLDRPNVLVLDEPGNDLDTQMLAAMENLLDTWPGTLLLVTHDRYLMERVTDDQFALIDGKLRHCPGGVDEYLRLLDERDAAAAASTPGRRAGGSSDILASAPQPERPTTMSAAEARDLRKQLYSLERRMSTLQRKVEAIIAKMHEMDPMDYMGLGALQVEQRELEAQIRALEDEWLDISERLE
ncbi:MAG: ABC-F family ATP-binding cassette domain-containing protein, partial [Coriobacteriales bacterium]|nr:ABC-F family ATP-binding cassette domain-containing protein [Coriobacteriales bacterium]